MPGEDLRPSAAGSGTPVTGIVRLPAWIVTSGLWRTLRYHAASGPHPGLAANRIRAHSAARDEASTSLNSDEQPTGPLLESLAASRPARSASAIACIAIHNYCV
jgi:hypothetical protein